MGQTISFSNTGRILSSESDILPTSQSNSCQHFVHSELTVTTLFSHFLIANVWLRSVARRPRPLE